MKKETFIIAELSANHNGDIKLAIETIRAAKRAGADAIKLQTYTADTLTIDCKNDYFKINHGTAWDGDVFTRPVQRGIDTLGLACRNYLE